VSGVTNVDPKEAKELGERLMTFFPPNVAAITPPSNSAEEVDIVFRGMMTRLKMDYGPRAGLTVIRGSAPSGRLPRDITPELFPGAVLSYLHRLPAGKKPRPVWERFGGPQEERPLLFQQAERLTDAMMYLAPMLYRQDGSILITAAWFHPSVGGRDGLPPLVTWPGLKYESDSPNLTPDPPKKVYRWARL